MGKRSGKFYFRNEKETLSKLGFGEQMKVKSCKTRSFRYDDDMADAICISLYGFSGYPYTLSLEQ